MKLISWNVNGLRACIQKGFLEEFDRLDADFFCLQETKLQAGQITLELPGYEQYWCYAEKKGYSGTAIFTKHTPISVSYGIGAEDLDNEGRVITLEYPEFYLVTCYTPNAQRGLTRLNHRMKWDEAFRAYLKHLDGKHPVILCGDLNVAHREIDLKNPQSNRGNAGFSDEERESFTKTLELGFTDTFRHLHPDATGMYSWWSYMYHARENNAGWRIDYFLVSDRIKDQVFRTPIYKDIMGSDHCPVGLELDILCNGSMWSPMSMGKARDLTPVKEKKAPKILATCLALLLTLGLGIFIGSTFFGQKNGGETPSNPFYQENDYFQVFVYSVPMVQDYQAMDVASSMVHECLYVPTSGVSPTFYYLGLNSPDVIPGVPLPNGAPANFFIQITLTERGLEQYSAGQFPQITASDSGTMQTALREYKNDNWITQGWFFYGYTLDAATVQISFGGKAIEAAMEPLDVNITGTVFSVTQDPNVSADKWEHSSSDAESLYSYTNNGTVYILGEPIYPIYIAPESINFALRLELTEFGRNLVASGKLQPIISQQALSIYSSYFDDLSGMVIQPYYLPQYSASTYGYVLYGMLSRQTSIGISIGKDEQDIRIVPGLSTDFKVQPCTYMTVAPDSSDTYLYSARMCFQEGDSRYYILDGQAPPACNYFVRVELTEAGRQKNYSTDALQVIRLSVSQDYSAAYSIYIYAYTTSEILDRIDGWIVCGLVMDDETLQIKLGDYSETTTVYNCSDYKTTIMS